MSYATLQNLKDYLGAGTSPLGAYNRLTDRVAGTTANDAVGQELVDLAQGEVNSWLGRRYVTPIDASADATLAQTLRDFTLAIAGYKAYALHPRRPTPQQSIKEHYEAALERLKAIANGAAALPGATPIPGPTTGGAAATAVGDERVFTREAMEGL